eukprot:scaffold211341_cov32-Tisochrysis_lutea.AAC.1
MKTPLTAPCTGLRTATSGAPRRAPSPLASPFSRASGRAHVVIAGMAPALPSPAAIVSSPTFSGSELVPQQTTPRVLQMAQRTPTRGEAVSSLRRPPATFSDAQTALMQITPVVGSNRARRPAVTRNSESPRATDAIGTPGSRSLPAAQLQQSAERVYCLPETAPETSNRNDLADGIVTPAAVCDADDTSSSLGFALTTSLTGEEKNLPVDDFSGNPGTHAGGRSVLQGRESDEASLFYEDQLKAIACPLGNDSPQPTLASSESVTGEEDLALKVGVATRAHGTAHGDVFGQREEHIENVEDVQLSSENRLLRNYNEVLLALLGRPNSGRPVRSATRVQALTRGRHARRTAARTIRVIAAAIIVQKCARTYVCTSMLHRRLAAAYTLQRAAREMLHVIQSGPRGAWSRNTLEGLPRCAARSSMELAASLSSNENDIAKSTMPMPLHRPSPLLSPAHIEATVDALADADGVLRISQLDERREPMVIGPTFRAAGHKWRLWVRPPSASAGREHIGVYLAPARDFGTLMTADFSLAVVGRNGVVYQRVVTDGTANLYKKSSGHGFPQFIRREDLQLREGGEIIVLALGISNVRTKQQRIQDMA